MLLQVAVFWAFSRISESLKCYSCMSPEAEKFWAISSLGKSGSKPQTYGDECVDLNRIDQVDMIKDCPDACVSWIFKQGRRYFIIRGCHQRLTGIATDFRNRCEYGKESDQERYEYFSQNIYCDSDFCNRQNATKEDYCLSYNYRKRCYDCKDPYDNCIEGQCWSNWCLRIENRDGIFKKCSEINLIGKSGCYLTNIFGKRETHCYCNEENNCNFASLPTISLPLVAIVFSFFCAY